MEGGSFVSISAKRRSHIEDLDPVWVRPVIGGRAANSKRLSEELDPACDPLGPENLSDLWSRTFDRLLCCRPPPTTP